MSNYYLAVDIGASSGRHILGHLEDGKIVQCGLGKGIIDFEFLIDTIKQYSPNATMVFEGVVGNDIKTSKLLIDSLNK